jgi:hypothetical protein
MPAPRNHRKYNRRSPIEREQDMVDVARLYLQGFSPLEISNQLSTIRPYKIIERTVERDIELVRSRWLENAMIDYGQMKANQLAKIDELERIYWRAWYDSWKDKEVTFQEKIEELQTNANAPAVGKQRVSKQKETQLGDTRYLEGIKWCVEERAKMFGLHMPEKQVNWRIEAKKAGIPQDEAYEQFENMVESFTTALARRNGDGSTGPSEEEG